MLGFSMFTVKMNEKCVTLTVTSLCIFFLAVSGWHKTTYR